MAELPGLAGVEEFTAEDLNESSVFSFVEMDSDRGGFDKLHGRVAQQIGGTESFDQGLTVTLHLNGGAKSDDELFDFSRVSDGSRVAIIQIQRGKHAPTF